VNHSFAIHSTGKGRLLGQGAFQQIAVTIARRSSGIYWWLASGSNEDYNRSEFRKAVHHDLTIDATACFWQEGVQITWQGSLWSLADTSGPKSHPVDEIVLRFQWANTMSPAFDGGRPKPDFTGGIFVQLLGSDESKTMLEAYGVWVEKSMYGKFFEKMIMGSVLSVLGFKLADEDSPIEKSFWLSSRGRKRESDATAIWTSGEGIRFDIGFIGVGNPEITLDKVSRFEREIDLNGIIHSMHTIIIVDRVGKNSRIIELANEIDGRVIQMSSSDWAKSLGREMEDIYAGYKSPLSGLSHSAYAKAIEEGVAKAPLEKIFQIAVSTDDETDVEIEIDEE
jgi:hypothetical protein